MRTDLQSSAVLRAQALQTCFWMLWGGNREPLTDPEALWPQSSPSTRARGSPRRLAVVWSVLLQHSSAVLLRLPVTLGWRELGGRSRSRGW